MDENTPGQAQKPSDTPQNQSRQNQPQQPPPIPQESHRDKNDEDLEQQFKTDRDELSGSGEATPLLRVLAHNNGFRLKANEKGGWVATRRAR